MCFQTFGPHCMLHKKIKWIESVDKMEVYLIDHFVTIWQVIPGNKPDKCFQASAFFKMFITELQILSVTLYSAVRLVVEVQKQRPWQNCGFRRCPVTHPAVVPSFATPLPSFPQSVPATSPTLPTWSLLWSFPVSGTLVVTPGFLLSSSLNSRAPRCLLIGPFFLSSPCMSE